MTMLAFQVDHDREAGGPQLRHLLREHDRYLNLRLTRITLVHALAILGLIVWCLARWPAFSAAVVRDLTLAFWISGFVVAIFVGLQEWHCHRRLVKLAEEPVTRRE